MFHVKHEGWIPPELEIPIDVAQLSALRKYTGLLREVAVPRKMIAPSDSLRIWSRHVLDGVRGAGLIPPHGRTAYDLGSGAGIPGVPVAIARPEVRFVLTEPRRGRAAFLELVVERLGLDNVTVHVGRAEELGPRRADACLARAFRGPSESWDVAEPLLASGGVLLYWAGGEVDVHVDGVRSQAFSTPSLADAGPIVMMTRQ
jgi:16S rRNA (guanine527-N7)-methyltransferase